MLHFHPRMNGLLCWMVEPPHEYLDLNLFYPFFFLFSFFPSAVYNIAHPTLRMAIRGKWTSLIFIVMRYDESVIISSFLQRENAWIWMIRKVVCVAIYIVYIVLSRYIFEGERRPRQPRCYRDYTMTIVGALLGDYIFMKKELQHQ